MHMKLYFHANNLNILGLDIHAKKKYIIYFFLVL